MTVNRSDFQKQTLSGVTAGDKFLVLDEGGTDEPGVVTGSALAASAPFSDAYIPKSLLTTTGDLVTNSAGDIVRVTRDVLAQDTAFSSRYVPLASARIFLTAQQFGAIGGSPVMGTLGNGANIQSRTAAMLFDAADFECVSATFVMPPSWATFSTHLWWSNAGAGAGDVLWVHYNDQFNDADSSNAAPAGTFATVTAPSQYDLKRTSFSGTTTATAGQLVRITIARSGTNIADTLNNDAGLVAVEIVRAS